MRLESILGNIAGGVAMTLISAGLFGFGLLNFPFSAATAPIWFVLMLLLFFVSSIVGRVVRFSLTPKERKACGLYIETYDGRAGGEAAEVIAPFVIYYDVLADQMKITGGAYGVERGPDGGVGLKPYATWYSVVAFIMGREGSEPELYCLHHGDRAGEVAPDAIPGITNVCVPTGQALRRGFFCDLVASKVAAAESFSPTYFDVVTAPEATLDAFRAGLGAFKRLRFAMKIGASTETAMHSAAEAYLQETGRQS